MDGLALTVTTTGTATSSSFCTFRRKPICPFSFVSRRRAIKTGYFCRKSNKFAVFASKEEPPKLDPLHHMELKFGCMPGEDPKLTLAKIMGRKANPDAAFIDIEKSFYKNKGKVDEVKGVPIDWAKDGQSPSPLDGLNLNRPVRKKGFEFKSNDDKPIAPKIKRPSQPVGKAAEGVKRSVPNVILRKPSMVNVPDVKDKPSGVRLKSNLSLKMRSQPAKEEFSDMTLLWKPEPMIVDESSDAKEERRDDVSNFTLLNKPKAMDVKTEIESSKEQITNPEYVESDVVSAIGSDGLKRSLDLTGTAYVTPSTYEESVEISFMEMSF